MSNRALNAVVTAAMVACLVTLVGASTPTFWTVSTQADFLAGEVENLSVDSDGRLLLGLATEQVYETSAPFLWTLAAGPDRGLWVGSGNEGKVVRIDRSGQGSVFFDAPELEVHALAPAPDGGLYVGTSPEGRIYHVAPDGTSKTFFEPEAKYIWALVVDSKGTVYAGTGDKGQVYRITPEGKGEVLYKTKATNVTALALDGTEALLVGTESPGQVLRIDQQGKPFVLLDSSFKEIRALRVDQRGLIYAAAVSDQPVTEEGPAETKPSEQPPVMATPTVSTEITAFAIVDVSAAAAQPSTGGRREDRRTPKGAVFRIAADGGWDTIWESSEDTPYDVAFDAEGVLVGTGGKGKIYRVSGEPSKTTLVARAAAQQVTGFLREDSGQHYFITSNPGKVFRLSAARAVQGTYESKVRDAETVASWGVIRWRAHAAAGARVELYSRSGNTATPDETWSDWSAAYTDPDGQQITSPKARYLQWKALLSGKDASPVLTSVTAAYLQRNLRPEVSSITVHPPGSVFQRPFSTGEPEIAGYEDSTSDGGSPAAQAASGTIRPSAPAIGRRIYQKGLQTFIWKADDRNGDRLQYDILYRREGETEWKAFKRGLWDAILVWDTTAVPDGSYVIKVVASDAPSNSPGTALSGEMESTPFEIDNTPPLIEVGAQRQQGSTTIVPFVVRDGQSAVQRVEYSTDANRWRVIYPKDGIADSRLEQFEIVLEAEAGETVTIRATDSMSNVATAVGGLGGQVKR